MHMSNYSMRVYVHDWRFVHPQVSPLSSELKACGVHAPPAISTSEFSGRISYLTEWHCNPGMSLTTPYEKMSWAFPEQVDLSIDNAQHKWKT
jgi:hypothetical protein